MSQQEIPTLQERARVASGTTAVTTGKTYMHVGGTDVVRVLSLQNHTPSIH